MYKTPIEVTKHDWSIDLKPVVTVCMWTYNHKDFIERSITSILMQKTNFAVQIIIQDDASTDGTKDVIKEYNDKYPNLFDNILFEVNQYSQGKDITKRLLTKGDGQYIALIQGDDYWTDPYKLQKQVDFLEKMHSAVAVCTNATLDSLDNEPVHFFNLNDEFLHKIELKEIYRQNVFPTLTGMYKADILKKIKFKNQIFLGDWFCIINAMQSGDAYRLNFVSAHYRIHRNGVFSSKSEREKLLAHIQTALIIIRSGVILNKALMIKENNLKIQALFKIDLKNSSYKNLIIDLFLLVKNNICTKAK